MMSDHQDSEHFMGVRSEDELLAMLDKAELRMNAHKWNLNQNLKRERKIYHMRNYKALEGVVKTLRWCLGDKDVEHPLE